MLRLGTDVAPRPVDGLCAVRFCSYEVIVVAKLILGVIACHVLALLVNWNFCYGDPFWRLDVDGAAVEREWSLLIIS